MPKDRNPEDPGFDGIGLTRRLVTGGLVGLAATVADPAAAQQRPAQRPATPPPPPRPAVAPGQSFTIAAEAPPGTMIGTVATTGPAATGFAIAGANPAGVTISPLGTLSVGQGRLAPGTLSLEIVAQGAPGAGPAQRVGLQIAPATPFRAIAGLVIEGTGAPAGAVSSFGMAFAEGDVPEGAPIAILRGAAPLRSQATVLKRHPDGSARHAVMAVEVPTALAEGQRLETRIAVGAAHPDPGAELDMAALLRGRQARVTVRPLRGGGAPWTCDLVALLPQERRMRGPLLAEARVAADVPAAAAGGATSLRLFADLALHKDGALLIDLTLRNDIGFVRSSGTAQYALTLEQDGRTTLDVPEVTHALYASLMRLRIPPTLPGGAPAPARPHIRHDVAYLSGPAGIAAHFDARLGLQPGVEPDFRARMRRPEWSRHPFPDRYMSYGMGAPGVREDMGPITRAQAHWLMDGHRTYQAYALDQAEASAGCPWNIWDPTGGPQKQGAWLNLIDRPIWADGRDRAFFPNPDPAATPWQIVNSHMPSCHFIPYVLTGKRALLDAMLGQSSWAIANVWNEWYVRGRGWDPQTAEGMNVNRNSQWRSHGWVYREVLNAAYICPPAEEPHPGYFDTVAVANMRWYNSRIPVHQAQSGEIYGHFRDSYSLGTVQNNYSYHTEYILSSLVKAVWFGIPGAREFLDWSLNWHAGRFLQEPVFNASIFVRLEPGMGGFAVRTWEQLEAVQSPSLGPLPVRDWNQTGEASFDCMPFVAMNVATLVDLFPDDPRVARAWRWFQRHNVPDLVSMTDRAFSGDYSQRSVVPQGRTRAAIAPALLPDQAFRVAEDQPPGAVVGVLRSRGGLATRYAIVGGSHPELFAVDDAGVVTLADALNHDEAARHVLSMTAANAHGTSAPMAVLVEVTRATLRPPAIAAVPPFTVAANARTGYAFGSIAVEGSPARLALIEGNRDGRFAIDAFGRISVARPLTGLVGQRFDLAVQARNRAGAVTEVVGIGVVPPAAAPAPADTPLDAVEGAAPGTVLGRVANRGGPARFVLAGGGDGRFAVEAESGEIRVAAPFARVEAASRELTVEAANGTGAARTKVRITVLPARYAHAGQGLRHAAALGLRRLRENHTGPLLRAVRPADGAELDLGTAGPDGRLDLRALIRFARGGPTEVAIWYDQSPLAAHWQAPDTAHRPLLTGADGMPFPLGPQARPALRFTGNRGLLNPDLMLPGGKNFALLLVFEHTAAAGRSPHLLAFHGDAAATGAAPRLRLLPDGRASLDQRGNALAIVTAEAVPTDRPVVLGVAYRGDRLETQLWWANGSDRHGGTRPLADDFPRNSVARLGHNGPRAEPSLALEGLIAEIYVTEGAGVPAEMLDRMGRTLGADFGL